MEKSRIQLLDWTSKIHYFVYICDTEKQFHIYRQGSGKQEIIHVFHCLLRKQPFISFKNIKHFLIDDSEVDCTCVCIHRQI